MTRFSTSLLVGTALAALLSSAAHAQTLNGGNSAWTATTNSQGFVINDASFTPTTQGDAFDDALVTSIDGVFTSGTVGSVTTGALGQLLSSTGAINGLSFTKTFLAYSSVPILRTSLTLTNTTGSAISFSLLLQNNVGSDGSTQVITTSSGDTAFTVADNYIVTDDGTTTGGDPTNTHVLYTPGGLLPTVVGQTTTYTNAGTQGVTAEFTNVLIGAGNTATFLFFNRLDGTASDALTNASVFASSASVQSAGLVSDLTTAQLATVRNGSFGAAVVPEAGTLALLTPVLGMVGGVALRRRFKK